MSASNRAVALRAGRTCYDHFAGRVGVAITDALQFHEAVLFDDPPAGIAAGGLVAAVRLGPGADQIFDALGVGLDLGATTSTRRPALRLCVAWSERRFHLAGALGAAMLDSCLRRDWVTRRSGRSVQLTAIGREQIETVLPGIQLDLLPIENHPERAGARTP